MFQPATYLHTFTAKLTGKNKGKRRYAEAKNYATSLTKVFNSFRKGGVIKAQTGTIKYQNGGPAMPGLLLYKWLFGKEKDEKGLDKWHNAVYSTFDSTWDTPPWYVAIAKGIRAKYKQKTNFNNMDYHVTDSVADAGWRKRLGLPYNNKFLPENGDGSVRLPEKLENEIPIDTALLKNRIANNEKLAESNKIMGNDWKLVRGLVKLDKQTLDSLRHTYKTGEPVVINEYSHNSRSLVKDGELIKNAHSYNTPLNILKNYTIQYNAKNRAMDYRDKYDFNGYEPFVPGTPFKIQGTIKLDRK